MSPENANSICACPPVPRAGQQTPASPLAAEVIDLFVHLARLFGLPKSLAEVYGLLFITPEPLSMEDVMVRLDLSKGSACQGLKVLRELGFVKAVDGARSRRDYFVAEMELRELALGLLQEKLAPHFEESTVRLGRIERALQQLPTDEQNLLAQRVKKLRQWERRGNTSLPWLIKIISLRAPALRSP